MDRVTRRFALIVEDDPSLQQSVRKRLSDMKFDVVSALDYQSAVRQLADKRPDIVLVDLGLPRESGYELCEYIRRQATLLYVPILVISERNFPEDMAHAEEAGANAFLKKPFTMERLTKYVEALLDGPHASRPSVRRLRLQ
jgi:two-component system chemotaxis response regulator CheY